MGIKPLYWSIQNKILYFGSQPKCFIANKYWKKKIQIKSLLYYFQFGYITPPNSIFENTFQIKPGHYLSFDSKGAYQIKKYWDLNKKINKNTELSHSTKEYTERLKDLPKSWDEVSFKYKNIFMGLKK